MNNFESSNQNGCCYVPDEYALLEEWFGNKDTGSDDIDNHFSQSLSNHINTTEDDDLAHMIFETYLNTDEQTNASVSGSSDNQYQDNSFNLSDNFAQCQESQNPSTSVSSLNDGSSAHSTLYQEFQYGTNSNHESTNSPSWLHENYVNSQTAILTNTLHQALGTATDYADDQQDQSGLWDANRIQFLISNTTNPVGKFLRDAKITAEAAARSNIMPYLIKVHPHCCIVSFHFLLTTNINII
jgi:hypothetical protein